MGQGLIHSLVHFKRRREAGGVGRGRGAGGRRQAGEWLSCLVVEWAACCVPAAERPASCVRPKPAAASASPGKACPTVQWYSDKAVRRCPIGTIRRAFEGTAFLNRLPLEGGPPCPPPGRPGNGRRCGHWNGVSQWLSFYAPFLRSGELEDRRYDRASQKTSRHRATNGHEQGPFIWQKIEVCLGILSHFGLISA